MQNNNLTKSENILDQIIESKFIVLSIIFVFLIISIFLTSLQKKEYSSNVRVLILQRQEQKLDAYIASKASESLAQNLKKGILTSSFRNKVLEDFDTLNFSKEEQTRRKEWAKAIDIKIIPNTSILQITCYEETPYQSEKFVSTVLNTLLEYHKEYHGGGDEVELRVIDYPMTSKHPTRPDWLMNIALSILLAIFFVITMIILFPNKIETINTKFKNINSKRKNKKIEKVFNIEIPKNTQHDNCENNQKNNIFIADERKNKINLNDYLTLDLEDKNKQTNEYNNIENIDNYNNDNEPKINIIGSDHYLKRK